MTRGPHFWDPFKAIHDKSKFPENAAVSWLCRPGSCPPCSPCRRLWSSACWSIQRSNSSNAPQWTSSETWSSFSPTCVYDPEELACFTFKNKFVKRSSFVDQWSSNGEIGPPAHQQLDGDVGAGLCVVADAGSGGEDVQLALSGTSSHRNLFGHKSNLVVPGLG